MKQCSFDALPAVVTEKFDYIFSNFGGLNCCEDLSRVAKDLPALLNGHGFVTWVIMPRICPWELGGLLTGRRNALRRLSRGGTLAQLEGEHFQTYYYSLSQIREAVGPEKVDDDLVRAFSGAEPLGELVGCEVLMINRTGGVIEIIEKRFEPGPIAQRQTYRQP